MNLALIFKIAGVGMLITAINTVLEANGRKDWSSYVTLGGIIITMTLVMGEVHALFETVKTMFML